MRRVSVRGLPIPSVKDYVDAAETAGGAILPRPRHRGTSTASVQNPFLRELRKKSASSAIIFRRNTSSNKDGTCGRRTLVWP